MDHCSSMRHNRRRWSSDVRPYVKWVCTVAIRRGKTGSGVWHDRRVGGNVTRPRSDSASLEVKNDRTHYGDSASVCLGQRNSRSNRVETSR